MNGGLDIERILDLWLDEGPRTIADRVVADALEIVERTEQPGAARYPRRVSASPLIVRLAAAAALVAVVGVGLLAVGALRTDHGPVPVAPTPRSSAAAVTPRPSSSPHLTASKPPRPAGATLLLMGVPMETGQTYTTLSFLPAFIFRGAPGWQLPLPPPGGDRSEGPAHAYFLAPDAVSGNPYLVPSLVIVRPATVISEGGSATGPAPTDLVGWLRARTDLLLGPPTSVTVGGFAGTMLEGTVRAGAKTNAEGSINLLCSSDTTPCGWTNGGGVGVGMPGERFRFVVVDVRGQTVLLLASSGASTWTRDLPVLEGLMDSITFPDPAGG